MTNEIELKLEVAPDVTERLIVDRSWLDASDCRTERQLSVYYDTPDFELRECGYSLRVRTVGDRFIQTLKRLDSGAAIFDRGEWEVEIDGPEPNLAQLSDGPIEELRIDRLEPVIRTEVDRTRCRIKRDDGELELDVDLGILSASAREMPVSEVELELIGGEPRATIEVAKRIAAEFPVKLAVMSKAERGFALADGTLSEPAKAEPIQTRCEMTVAEGFETIVSACLRQFRLNEPILIDLRDVEALHQARVAIRRLRSALSLFRPVVFDHELPRIEEELRWFTAELGDARTLDVYLDRDLSPDQRHFVEERRKEAYELAIAAIDSSRFRRLMLDIAGWAAVGQWRENPCAAEPLQPFVDCRIDRIWSKIRKARKVRAMSDKRRHHLRIRMKKLRYGLEFTAAMRTRGARRQKKFTKAVKDLQDALGDLHDIVAARSLVTLNSWISAQGPSKKNERRLVRDADRALKRLRRIGAYWS
jgi:inorganic triphosphatase YgiF